MDNNLIGISGKIGAGKDLVGQIIQYITTPEDSNEFTLEDYINDSSSYLYAGNKWTVKKFADKLKDTVCLLIGCTRADLEDREFKETPLGEEWWYYKIADNIILPRGYYPNQSDNDMCEERYLVKATPRLFLQLMGTEAGRKIIHPNVWVNSLFADYTPRPKGKAHTLEDWSELYVGGVCNNCGIDFSGYKRQPYCKKCTEDDSVQIYPNWLITDVRFPNEINAIKKNGGITIRVNRPMSQRFPELWEKHQKEEGKFKNPEFFMAWIKDYDNEIYKKLMHASEISVDKYKDWDYEIDNDGTIEDLQKKLEKILNTSRIEKIKV
tara:strand:+ start:104754 stop:105722 length:969 start_codon:yes stop_codon:yes gene_type:complete